MPNLYWANSFELQPHEKLLGEIRNDLIPGAAQQRKENLRGVPTLKGKDRDEFPPAMVRPTGKVSVKYISPSDNRGAGAHMKNQLRGVRFGPLDRYSAYNKTSTYLMRNASAKVWASYAANGSTMIELGVWDTFEVKENNTKDGRYNRIARILEPIWEATGANPDMQTRSSWEVILDY